MADLAANLPENLRNAVLDVARKIEIIGPDETVLNEEHVVALVNKLNEAMGGMRLTDGTQISLADFADSEKRGELLDSLSGALNQVKNNQSIMGLVTLALGDNAPVLFENTDSLIQAIRDYELPPGLQNALLGTPAQVEGEPPEQAVVPDPADTVVEEPVVEAEVASPPVTNPSAYSSLEVRAAVSVVENGLAEFNVDSTSR